MSPNISNNQESAHIWSNILVQYFIDSLQFNEIQIISLLFMYFLVRNHKEFAENKKQKNSVNIVTMTIEL